MNDCAFCLIAKGQKDAHKVYEDESIMAFLDAHPINPGHTLVIPKEHVEEFQEMSGGYYDHMMEVVQRVSRDIKTKLNPPRVGLWVHGFEMPHVHVHVVPLYKPSDIAPHGHAELSDQEMGKIATQLKG